jgi:uncharacterized protein YggE
MKTLVVCAFALVPLTVIAAEVTTLTGLPNQPFLYVEGTAKIEKAPDIISLDFNVEGRNAEQGKANQEVQAKAKKVFALLKEAKIEDRDVVAQDLQSEAEYERDESDSKKRGKLTGYVVTPQFSIAVRDVTKYGKLGDQIMDLGGVCIFPTSAAKYRTGTNLAKSFGPRRSQTHGRKPKRLSSRWG